MASATIPDTMTATVIDAFGPPDVFRQTRLPTPTPGPGEVLVRVHATSVNPVDYKIRSGAAAGLAPAFPAVLHMDLSGEVVSLGDGVEAFAVGDAVFGCAGGLSGSAGELSGALADYMVCDPALLAPKPATLTHRQAAALPLVWLTAWEGLAWTKATVREGDHVLVYGGTGGVGHVAVQLAKALGATVTATASSSDKAQTARDLGADHVSDYHTEDIGALVERVTGGAGFDIVVDTIAGDHLAESFEAVKINGHVVSVGAGAGLDLSPLHGKGLSLDVVFMLLPMLTGVDRPRHGHALREAARYVAQGQLRPLVDERRFGLDEAAAAHAHADAPPVGARPAWPPGASGPAAARTVRPRPVVRPHRGAPGPEPDAERAGPPRLPARRGRRLPRQRACEGARQPGRARHRRRDRRADPLPPGSRGAGRRVPGPLRGRHPRRRPAPRLPPRPRRRRARPRLRLHHRLPRPAGVRGTRNEAHPKRPRVAILIPQNASCIVWGGLKYAVPPLTLAIWRTSSSNVPGWLTKSILEASTISSGLFE